MSKWCAVGLLTILVYAAFGANSEGIMAMSIKKESFGKTPQGEEVFVYTLENANGLEAKILTYGGTVMSLKVPDRNGNRADVVLGYDSLEGYIKDTAYFGCIVGRYANRIAGGKVVLDGVEYQLAKNDGNNHLHGGIRGFNKVVWAGQAFESDDGVSLRLSYTSKDGEEGYPGTLRCMVVYSLTNNDELKVEYEAETDKPTVVNLTHHGYFNLAGCGAGDILNHELQINADKFTDFDDELIPTGQIVDVKGTPFDFTEPRLIGERIRQVKGGYDLNYVLNRTDEKSLVFAARVREPKSGRVMEVYTTEPGIQFYSGNFLNKSVKGKGFVYDKHSGFCLETQHFPDSPNKPQFPSVILRENQKYRSVTIYRFKVE